MKGILFFDVDGTLIDSGHGREVPDESNGSNRQTTSKRVCLYCQFRP